MGTVVVIGAGAAGSAAAFALRRQLDRGRQVIVLEQEPVVYNRPALPLLAAGRRSRSGISRSVAALGNHGIHVIIDRALCINATVKTVYTVNREIQYDLLVVAAGAPDGDGAPAGAGEAGLNILSPEGAAGIHSRIQNFQGEEIAVVIPDPPLKNPASPYECAFLLEDWFKRRGRGKDVSISIFSPEPAPLAVYGHRVSEAVTELLLQRGIRMHLNSRIERVNREERKIEMSQRSFPFDLLLYSPGAAPPPLIAESGLADPEGWLAFDPHFLTAGQEGIFGAGDVIRVKTPSGAELPKTGGIARLHGLIVAANAARLLKGESIHRSYSGQAREFLETGRGALFFSGGFYHPAVNFRLYPFSRVWSPLRRHLLENSSWGRFLT